MIYFTICAMVIIRSIIIKSWNTLVYLFQGYKTTRCTSTHTLFSFLFVFFNCLNIPPCTYAQKYIEQNLLWDLLWDHHHWRKWLSSSVSSKETCSIREVSGTCIVLCCIFQMNASTCQSTYPTTTGLFIFATFKIKIWPLLPLARTISPTQG